MAPSITPVLLAGGVGARLWPLSRRSLPKQFALTDGGQSLFQRALGRVNGAPFAAPIITCAQDLRFLAAQHAQDVGVRPAAIFLEPDGRNTAPAALIAALSSGPDALILLMPCDHVLPDDLGAALQLSAAAQAAQQGRIVCFGTPAHCPSADYGYLHLGAEMGGGGYDVKGFIEKPEPQRAADLLASGHHLWNSGIFLMRADVLISTLRRLDPALFAACHTALTGARQDLDFTALEPVAWAQIEAISIDHAVMERTDGLCAFLLLGDWHDLGALDRLLPTCADMSKGRSLAIDCVNSDLIASDAQQSVVGIGLHDTVVVATPDAVLVAARDQLGQMRRAVHEMRKQGIWQADLHPTDHRPWGSFRSLALDQRFQVKQLRILPGAQLSLQSHLHRQEHWIIVSGTVQAHLDGQDHLLSEGQSICVPIGMKHRLSNPGKLPAVVIEVQTGSYLGEDDIERFEDIYARAALPKQPEPQNPLA